MWPGAARLYFPQKCCQLPKRFGIETVVADLFCAASARSGDTEANRHALRYSAQHFYFLAKIGLTMIFVGAKIRALGPNRFGTTQGALLGEALLEFFINIFPFIAGPCFLSRVRC